MVFSYKSELSNLPECYTILSYYDSNDPSSRLVQGEKEMKRLIFPLLGFILFGFSSYVEKNLPEILNNFALQIIIFIIFITEIFSFILISFLIYNRLEEIKKKPEKLPLLLALISLLWLTRRIYIGYGIMELALGLFVLNLIIFLRIAFSKKVQRGVALLSLISIALIGAIFVISTQIEFSDPKIILERVKLKFENSEGYEVTIHETASVLGKTESNIYRYTFKKPDFFKIQYANKTIICNESNSLCEHVREIEIMHILSYFENAKASEDLKTYKLKTHRDNTTFILTIRKATLLPSEFDIMSHRFNYTLLFRELKIY